MMFWDDDEELEHEPRELPVIRLDEAGRCCICGKLEQQHSCLRCGRPVCMDKADYLADSTCSGWIMDWWSNGAFDPDDGNEFWCRACLAEELASTETGGNEA